MLTLIIGDAASGKSEYAEGLAMKLCEKRIYLATMKEDGPESLERIEKHRRMREGKGFITYECPLISAGSDLSYEEDTFKDACVLIEDIPNLLANEMFSARSDDRVDPVSLICKWMAEIAGYSSHIVIVTGNLFSGGYLYDTATLDYLRKLADINRILAGMSDNVIEVTCGIADALKGRLQ